MMKNLIPLPVIDTCDADAHLSIVFEEGSLRSMRLHDSAEPINHVFGHVFGKEEHRVFQRSGYRRLRNRANFPTGYGETLRNQGCIDPIFIDRRK